VGKPVTVHTGPFKTKLKELSIFAIIRLLFEFSLSADFLPHWRLQMNQFKQFLGKACDGCSLCRYARDNPATMIGKIMAWHGKWCPAWKAQQDIERERQQAANRKSNARKGLRKKR
jgi:hypothetical protein